MQWVLLSTHQQKKGFLVLRSLLSSADNGGSGQGQCCLSVVRHVQFSKLCAFLSDRKHLDDGKLNRVSTPGGALGYFLGGYVPPGTPNWHPVLEMGQFFIPRSRIRPKTDTPF